MDIKVPETAANQTDLERTPYLAQNSVNSEMEVVYLYCSLFDNFMYYMMKKQEELENCGLQQWLIYLLFPKYKIQVSQNKILNRLFLPSSTNHRSAPCSQICEKCAKSFVKSFLTPYGILLPENLRQNVSQILREQNAVAQT